jgi:hypothetical protein
MGTRKAQAAADIIELSLKVSPDQKGYATDARIGMAGFEMR